MEHSLASCQQKGAIELKKIQAVLAGVSGDRIFKLPFLKSGKVRPFFSLVTSG